MVKTNKKPVISIVVPSYNSEKYIYDNLIELRSVLKNTKKSFEILCVVDGATDNTMAQVNKAAGEYNEIKAYTYKINQGKGYAVKFGVSKAKGDLVGFVDAGWDLDYKDFINFLKVMRREKAHIVVGSKRHAESVVKYPFYRRIFSFAYQIYVKILFNLPVSDTQVGMKLFKGKTIKKLVSVMTIKGFAFDIELLALAQKYLEAKMVEAPIHVNLDENSSTIKIKGGMLTNSLKVFWDTLLIYYRLNFVRFYKNLQ